MPHPTQVVALLKAQKNQHVRLYNADQGMLTALAKSGIQVAISVPNEELLAIGQSNSTAAKWVSRNVVAYYPATNITSICVGSEVLTTLPNAAKLLVNSLKYIHSALVTSNLNRQSTQKFQDDVFLEVIGGLDKKGRALGLGSHAAVLKESLKDSSYKDATISEEISILKAELQQKNIVQENITRKLVHYEQMFKRLMRDKNIKALLDAPEEEADAPEEEADYCNEEMGEAEMNDSLFH